MPNFQVLVTRRFARSAVAALFTICAPIAPIVAQTTRSTVAQSLVVFKNSPEQLLTTFPNGGVELQSRIREFALNDPTALDAMIGLIAKGNKDQKTAIAKGLGEAAKMLARTNRPYSETIQKAVAETKDLDAFTAYAEGAGDSGTAATGAGAAGSAGASGGQTSSLGTTGAGGGAAEAINGSSTNTGNFGFTSSVTGIGNNSTTGTTTISSTTSP
ncbi:hypothetical protein FIU28_16945 [Tardiphaga sp. vice154]|uniref:hypothetical protein n=1 Tax=Tardiphaga sp. vice154 TaxID=2592814 RepID=UPI001165C0C2|nr:hypothetical protein [Tardiphaga sp. vice154]QDM22649.1 hypothetical protein FIU28_16945 [Tardiphaga sp. vice154]